MSNTGQAWVTLATNDSYALGALVLAQSLKRNNTIHQLAVLITPGVSSAMREALSSTFDLVKEVDVLDSQDAANLALLARPDLGVTFTKLHCWNLTQYTKCVFLDADTLVIKNSDELFERDELSAAPDAGWPDCFNSGVFVFTPSETTFKSLLDFALTHGSFDGGDQGLLNMYFGDWATKDITKHLPFIYNMVATATYSYLPAFKAFGGNVKIAHFIGSSKPWLQALPSGTTLSNFLDLWWDIFLKDVSQKLNTNMGGLAGALAGGQKDVIQDQFRKQSWEQGNIDYMGRDAFENIWKKISETVEDIKPIETPPAPETPEESAPAPEIPKTEDKTDSPQVESQQISAPPVETPQPEVAQPQQGAPKVEAETVTAEAVEPPKAEAPLQPAEETPKEVSEPAAPPAEVAPAQPVPDAKVEEAATSAAPGATQEPVIPAVEVPAPIAVEPVPAAPTEPAVPATTEPAVPAPTEPAVPAPTEPAVPAPTEPAVPVPTVAAPQPPTPTVEPPTPPLPEPAKDPSTPPADKKAPSPPKDGGSEKVAAPVAPASPSTPSPASPSAPEGAKTDAAPPLPAEPQTPTSETSSPPQTPVGDAPVPPKRSSKKGKAKK